MPGSATLASNLVNELVPVADELRELFAEFGLDQWQVYRVVRTWSGTTRGDGTATDAATEITPTPRVGWVDAETSRISFGLPPTGVWETGEIALTEVSLTYAESALTGQSTSANVQIFYKLVDRQGNGMAARLFTVSRPPAPDRNKSIGWTVTLKRASAPVTP